MSSLDKSLAFDSVWVLEQSFVCETGGGFEEERYKVEVNDGWMSLYDVLKRRTVGNVTASLTDGESEAEVDDPHGAAGQVWGDRPAQCYWKRWTHVRAPVGTRFQKVHTIPNREPASVDWTLPSVPQDTYTTDLQLRGGRLVREDWLEQRARRKARETCPDAQPMSGAELARRARALLASLGDEGMKLTPRPPAVEDENEIADPPSEPGIAVRARHPLAARRSGSPGAI
jgi:hypothetical protein